MTSWIWMLALALAAPGDAEPAEPVAAEPVAEEPRDIEAVWADLSAVQSLRAEFTQTQHRKLLSVPLVSSGTLAFERPDRLRFEVSEPSPSTFRMDGSTVELAYPDLDVVESVDLAGSPEARRLVEGLLVWLAADREAVEADYDWSWDPEAATIALTPKRPALQALLSRIELTVTGEPAHVERVLLVEPDDDRVEIAISAVELDPELPASLFGGDG